MDHEPVARSAPVFVDGGRRRRRVAMVGWALGLPLAIWLVLAPASLLGASWVPALPLLPVVGAATPALHAADQKGSDRLRVGPAVASAADEARRSQPSQSEDGPSSTPSSVASSAVPAQPIAATGQAAPVGSTTPQAPTTSTPGPVTTTHTTPVTPATTRPVTATTRPVPATTRPSPATTRPTTRTTHTSPPHP